MYYVQYRIPEIQYLPLFFLQTELSAAYKTYLLDHPELRALLSDFLQKMLLAKPRNILDFSKAFFQPFLVARPDTPEEEEGDSASSKSTGIDDLDEGEWEGEGAWREKNYGFLNPTERPYQIEDYFKENDGFILQPRNLTAGSDDELLGATASLPATAGG
jgi:hypothetical protein